MSLLIDQYYTNHTSKHNKIIVDVYQGKRALFLESYDYREFVNPAQLNHVIHDMVVNKGFLMDSQISDKLVFTHSHNTKKSQTYYNFFTKTSEVEKVTRKFINFV